jgi:hypothetical protein
MLYKCAAYSALFKLAFLLVYLNLYVKVDTCDDQVRNDVQRADTHEDVGVIERNLFRHLHHHQDDHQVGTAHRIISIL